jgi:hypothetical protein
VVFRVFVYFLISVLTKTRFSTLFLKELSKKVISQLYKMCKPPSRIEPDFFEQSFMMTVLDKQTNFKRYMDRHSGGSWARNNINIQSADGTACGHYAVYAILTQSIPSLTGQKRSANTSWKDFTSPFNSPEDNDRLIRQKVKL